MDDIVDCGGEVGWGSCGAYVVAGDVVQDIVPNSRQVEIINTVTVLILNSADLRNVV